MAALLAQSSSASGGRAGPRTVAAVPKKNKPLTQLRQVHPGRRAAGHRIETLKSGNSVFPAALEVYDVDGLEGLRVPGAITRDTAKQAGAAGMLTMGTYPAAASGAVSAVKDIG